MIEIELHVSVGIQQAAVSEVVERACAGEGMQLALKGTLAKYPDSVHWHFKKRKQPGTLELTWWKKENRLWFKVAAGRTAPWLDETLQRLKREIEQALRDESQLD